MASGPSPRNLSPSLPLHSQQPATAFASNPSPVHAFASQRSMALESMSMPAAAPHSFNNLNTIGERNKMDLSSQPPPLQSLGQTEQPALKTDPETLPAIIIRKLPMSAHIDVVRMMLLFSKDLSHVSLTDSDLAEDKGYQTAIARFMSHAGATEAREKLNGKTMGGSSPLVVEHLSDGVASNVRRNTVDGIGMRHGPGSSSSLASSNGIRQSSRFNGTFQSLEKLSPPTNIDPLPAPESNNASIQNLFSPQSPLTNSNVSKSFINSDPDDDTGKLLSDAVAFSKGSDAHQTTAQRRIPGPSLPISRFAGLSLSTNNPGSGLTSPSINGMLSPRSLGPSQSPNPILSPNSLQHLSGLGPSATYPMPQQFHRPNYPPVNPADQNPPCNTLYVGNLPMDTSEDELKAIFSKQRGYKRLCFRTKANGPMCFVEFEDTSFATKALNELYGQPLHNSVKGGIRLSFSKNPLGVRSGQNTTNHNMLVNHGPVGISNHSANLGAFTTAIGPPPGLSAPPGFSSPPPPNVSNAGLGLYNNGAFAAGSHNFSSAMRQPLGSGVPSTMPGSGYSTMASDYSNYAGR